MTDWKVVEVRFKSGSSDFRVLQVRSLTGKHHEGPFDKEALGVRSYKHFVKRCTLEKYILKQKIRKCIVFLLLSMVYLSACETYWSLWSRSMAFCQMRTLGLIAGQTVSLQTKEDCSCLFSVWACSILARHNCVLGSIWRTHSWHSVIECLEKFGYLSTRNPRAGLMTLSQRLSLVLLWKKINRCVSPG